MKSTHTLSLIMLLALIPFVSKSQVKDSLKKEPKERHHEEHHRPHIAPKGKGWPKSGDADKKEPANKKQDKNYHGLNH